MNKTVGKLYVVGTPIGNLDDLSYRACETLKQVDWIAAEDTRESRKLLEHYNIKKEMVSLHNYNELDRCQYLIERLQQGEDGALISDAGTPCVSDPGAKLVQALYKEKIDVVPIPGPCAAIAAYSAAGLVNSSFIFIGFLPAKSQGRKKRLLEISKLSSTLVFYEAPHRIKDMLFDCHEILEKERRIVVARELTKKYESLYTGTIESIFNDVQTDTIPARGEFVVLIDGAGEKTESDLDEEEIKAKNILKILLAELKLKQAVNIATQLTGSPKNKLYSWAIDLKK
mgnify:CR=1 FL=1|tara:strand:+ start:41126 stop:41980 length:855 start_codon:yes stop_codon:yes gene_type:complete